MQDRAHTRWRWAAAAAAFVCAVWLGVASAPVAATPAQDLWSLRARVAEVSDEVERLDHRASVAVEKYNLARAELDDLNVQLIAMRADLARAQTQLDVARAVLGDRMADMYKNGGVSVLDIVLSAGDFTDIDTQIDYFREISQADRDTVAGIEELEANVSRLTGQIEGDRAEALEREMELRARRTDIEDQLAQRQALLADLDARVGDLVRQQDLREAAAAQRLADSTGVDLESINGSAAQMALVQETMRYLGIPYVWAGATPAGGFDCSGLVLYVYARFGVQFPHGATMQARMGTPVPFDQMEPADLVFFGSPAFYHHVGIYIGNGLFIEAPHTGDVVKVSVLTGRGVALACRYPIRLQ